MLSLKRSFFWSAAAPIAFIFADWCVPWRDCFDVQNSCNDWKLREISSKQNRTSSNLQTVQKPYRSEWPTLLLLRVVKALENESLMLSLKRSFFWSAAAPIAVAYLHRLVCFMTRLLWCTEFLQWLETSRDIVETNPSIARRFCFGFPLKHYKLLLLRPKKIDSQPFFILVHWYDNWSF